MGAFGVCDKCHHVNCASRCTMTAESLAYGSSTHTSAAVQRHLRNTWEFHQSSSQKRKTFSCLHVEAATTKIYIVSGRGYAGTRHIWYITGSPLTASVSCRAPTSIWSMSGNIDCLFRLVSFTKRAQMAETNLKSDRGCFHSPESSI